MFLLLIPFLMHIAWLVKKAKPMDILIIDKTVSDLQKNEHTSFTWLLNNLKIVHTNKQTLYSLDDYYGFFPQPDENFYVRDFERLNSSELKRLTDSSQVIYITDSYGVYSNEWYKHTQISERSNLIYGGLTGSEVDVLEQMKLQHKLIICEFNCIGSPTKRSIRRNFEELFHVKWTGWIGRYFEDLSSSADDIPLWLIRNYKQQHQNHWPFKKAGIVFVNENDQIEILERGTHLLTALPEIHTTAEHGKEFNIPEKIPYSYWFDIMQTDHTNIPVSLFHINTTAMGDSILNANGILKTFPAVMEHQDNDYTFYYFSGDFADNPISTDYSRYAGIAFVESIVSSFHSSNREYFYWNYYYPLITTLLTNYHQKNPNVH